MAKRLLAPRAPNEAFVAPLTARSAVLTPRLHAARDRAYWSVLLGEHRERILPIDWGRVSTPAYERGGELLSDIDALASSAPVALDAGEPEILAWAKARAMECERTIQYFGIEEVALAACMRIAARYSMPLHDKTRHAGETLKRAVCERFWRHHARKYFGRAFEGVAVRLGVVQALRGAYASNETCARRTQQNERNAAAMKATVLTNENGQAFTLADLAAKTVANRTVRRGELMTRIRGFEEIATECKHVGVFVTLTCPSRFHAVLRSSGRENTNYDGKHTPRDAQEYLRAVWARVRAQWAKQGITAYGFRVAEPHHDGCPHWHLLLFMARDKLTSALRTLRRRALADSGKELGASKHRCKVKIMRAEKGGAAAYIAKYIAKNIDGYAVERDLLGNDALQASQRVEAWAAVWGIRQFQQIGGPPVTLWREMRRIKAETVQNAPPCIKLAWAAVNKQGDKLASWADFVRALGGIAARRKDLKIRSYSEFTKVCGRYGYTIKAMPRGVYAQQWPELLYESVRYSWRVSSIGYGGRAKPPVVGGSAARSAAPWTRVNNCSNTSTVKIGERGKWREKLLKKQATLSERVAIARRKRALEGYKIWSMWPRSEEVVN